MELRLSQHELNNRGKKPEMRPNQSVFDSRNGRIVMKHYNHLFVAYPTSEKNAENPNFIRLLGKSLSSLIFSGVCLHTTRVGQTSAPRPKFLQTARPQDETVGTQSVKDKIIRDISAVKTPCPGIRTAIHCRQQISAMNAYFGLSQGDIE